MVKMLTVLVSKITNSQIFLLKKMLLHIFFFFFGKNISIYAIFNDKSLYILIFPRKHTLWVFIRSALLGASNEYPQRMYVSVEKLENYYVDIHSYLELYIHNVRKHRPR